MSECSTAVDTCVESRREVLPKRIWDFCGTSGIRRCGAMRFTGRNLATAMLLEVPLVIGRTSEGKAFAMRDSCPHRGIPLSYGHFDGKNLQCSYHGWEFEACSGRCVEIPSLTSHDKLKVERISAGHFPCEERDGYVWVYVNAPGTRLPETCACGAGTAKIQREIQDYAAGLRAAVARRSRNYRADGSGARAVCAPIVVLAEQKEHSREGQAV